MCKMMVKDAPTIWNTLRGIICIYKPVEVKVERIRHTIISKICQELNEMECRPPESHVRIEGDPSSRLLVKVEENFADNVLVVGPRYQPDDLVCSWSNYLGYNTSGVLLFGLRSGTKAAKFIRENRPIRAYRIKGELGEATDNAFKTGKVLRRSTWKHARSYHMETLLASMQSSHQRKMFEMCGVDMQSQSAYELARQGPIRPANSKVPLLYGIKCVDFSPPEFTLEIQCINEYEEYLRMLIHDIGEKLHSTAHCTGIQCIRHSFFSTEHALLTKHWTLQHILTNLETCNKIIADNEHLLEQKNICLQRIPTG